MDSPQNSSTCPESDHNHWSTTTTTNTNNKLRLQSWRFVERMLDIHHELQQEFGILNNDDEDDNESVVMTPMGIDEMMHSALRFLTLRNEFAKDEKPVDDVDVGYHYTSPEHWNSIVQDGLWSSHERPDLARGNTWGNGVYIAKDPISFSKGFGTLGILTARGKWGNRIGMPDLLQYGVVEPSIDTRLVQTKEGREFVVLQRSSQCLPIFSFQASMTGYDAPLFRRIVFCYHEKVQAVLDEILEHTTPTQLPIKEFGKMIHRTAVKHKMAWRHKTKRLRFIINKCRDKCRDACSDWIVDAIILVILSFLWVVVQFR
jgi:nitroreductase